MRKLPIPVRDSAIPVLVPILELPSVHFLFYVSWIVLLLWSVLAAHIVAVLVLSQLSRVCTGTGIRLLPIPVQACQYQYGHILGARSSIVFLSLTMPVPVQAFLQCPYRYWHPYSNNANTDMEHNISSAALKGIVRYCASGTVCRCYNMRVGMSMLALAQIMEDRYSEDSDLNVVTLRVAGVRVMVSPVYG